MMIMPAILTDSITAFHAQLQLLAPHFRNFQIDVIDGLYLPRKTVTLEAAVADIVNEPTLCKESGVRFDFDLMVKDYKQAIATLESSVKQISIGHVFVHYGSIAGETLPSSKNFSIGIAIAPQDQVDELGHNYDLDSVPCIQVMSVSPGSQGSPFVPETLMKIEQLRKTGYRSKIFLDGGANNKTLPVILHQQYRPDVICVGSFLSHSEDVSARAAELHALEQQ